MQLPPMKGDLGFSLIKSLLHVPSIPCCQIVLFLSVDRNQISQFNGFVFFEETYFAIAMSTDKKFAMDKKKD